MRAYDKRQESTVLEANGVDDNRFIIQFNKKAPHVRLYERKQRGPITIHKKLGEFFKVRRAVQRSWSISQEG